MFTNCSQDKPDMLFLRHRYISPPKPHFPVNTNPELSRKRSLKCLINVKSHSSLKTIDSLRTVSSIHASALGTISTEKHISGTALCPLSRNSFTGAFQNKEVANRKNAKIEQKIQIQSPRQYPQPATLTKPKIQFSYQKTMQKPEQIIDDGLLKQDLRETEPNTPEVNDFQSDFKINILPSEEIEPSIDDRQSNFDWKRTQTDPAKAVQHLRLPQKAKSTVSVLSQRSECDSVVIQKLTTKTHINRLL